MLIKYEVEHALFQRFFGAWLKNTTGSECIRILSRIDDLPPDPSGFEDGRALRESRRIRYAQSLWNPAPSSEPNSKSRYLLLLICAVDDEGALIVTEILSTVLANMDVRVTHPGFLSELNEKLKRTEEYLNTDPVEWMRRLVPIDDHTINIILDNPRLCYARCSAGIVVAPYASSKLVPLGVWARLWREGRSTFGCNLCAGTVYVFAVAQGLSEGRRTGVCGTCGSIQSERNAESFRDVWQMVRNLKEPEVRPYRIDSAIEVIKRELGRELRSAN